MNTVFVRSKRFERDECVAQWQRALTNLGHDNVTVEGDPGVIRIKTEGPVDLGLLLFISDQMKGHDYTTEIVTSGAGSVGLDLR